MPLFICIFMTEISQFSQAQLHLESAPSGIYRHYAQQHQVFHTDPSAMHICVAEHQVKHTPFL